MGEHEFFLLVHISDNHQFPAHPKEWEKHLHGRIRQACTGVGINCEVRTLDVTYINDESNNADKADTPF